MHCKGLSIAFLVLGLGLKSAWAVDSAHWQDFEKERQTKGITLMEHLNALSTVCDKDSGFERTRKKEALAYFLATGGKYGFRKTPPTVSEYRLLVKALAVAASLYDQEGRFLDLVHVRKGYGLTTEDPVFQSHAIQAQALVVYALSIKSFLKEVKDFSTKTPVSLALLGKLAYTKQDGYLTPLQALSPKPAPLILERVFNQGITQRAVEALLLGVAPSYPKKIDTKALARVKEILTAASAPQLPAIKSRSAAPSHPLKKPLKTVVLKDKTQISRQPQGLLSLTRGGGVQKSSSILVFNGAVLNGSWTDEELLDALKLYGLAQVLYA